MSKIRRPNLRFNNTCDLCNKKSGEPYFTQYYCGIHFHWQNREVSTNLSVVSVACI